MYIDIIYVTIACNEINKTKINFFDRVVCPKFGILKFGINTELQLLSARYEKN